MKYTKEWEDLTHQMGYWVDMKHPYITYDNRYMKHYGGLKQLHKKACCIKDTQSNHILMQEQTEFS